MPNNSIFPVEHPNLDKIKEDAVALADWIYDDGPAYEKMLDRLKMVMELYWYRGRDRVE